MRGVEKFDRLTDGHFGCVLLEVVQTLGQQGGHRAKGQKPPVLAWVILKLLGKDKHEVDFLGPLHAVDDEELGNNDVPHAAHPFIEIHR